MRLTRSEAVGRSSTTMSRHLGRTTPSIATSFDAEILAAVLPSAARIIASASISGRCVPLFERKSSAASSFGIMRR